jgi:hypothetical protein
MMVPGVGFEPSVNGEITRTTPFFRKSGFVQPFVGDCVNSSLSGMTLIAMPFLLPNARAGSK